MAVRLSKDWTPLDSKHVGELSGQLGVYQLGNEQGEILYIGVAGGRSRYGMRGELTDHLAAMPEQATCFRVEINMAYRTRHTELLQTFMHDHGRLPKHNTDVDPATLGRIRPGGG